MICCSSQTTIVASLGRFNDVLFISSFHGILQLQRGFSCYWEALRFFYLTWNKDKTKCNFNSLLLKKKKKKYQKLCYLNLKCNRFMTRFQRNKGQYVYSFLAWGGSKSRQLKSDFLVDNNNIKSAFVNRHVHPSKFFFQKDQILHCIKFHEDPILIRNSNVKNIHITNGRLIGMVWQLSIYLKSDTSQGPLPIPVVKLMLSFKSMQLDETVSKT